RHTTTSVERAVLRLGGLAGADGQGVPWANHLASAVVEQVGLEHGVALPVWNALLRHDAGCLEELAAKAAVGSARFSLPEPSDEPVVRAAARSAVAEGLARIDAAREQREAMVATVGDAPRRPWIYLIV